MSAVFRLRSHHPSNAAAMNESDPPVMVTVVVVSAAEAGTAMPAARAAEQARTSAVRVIEPMSETPFS